MILQILKEPVGSERLPLLHKPCEPIPEIDGFVRSVAENLIETAKANNGVGLAAPQIGLCLQMFVTLVGGENRVFINPKIQFGRNQIGSLERCLSLPDVKKTVMRSKRITISFQNLNGQIISMKAHGLLSLVLQHEYDHIRGILITDY